MKKFYYIAFISILSLISSAVTADAGFSIRTDSIYKSGSAGETEIVTHNIVYNNSLGPITLIWERQQDLPSGWGSLVCDNIECHSSTTSTYEFTIEPGDSSNIDVHLQPNNIKGSGTVNIFIYEKGSSINNAVKMVNFFETWDAGITNNNEINFRMYPTPVRDYLTIKFNKKGDHQIEVYNILGRRVIKRKISNGDYMRLSFNGFQSGMYVIMYRKEGGQVITKTVSKD